MLRVKTFTLALLAVGSLGGLLVTSASAHEFTAGKEGTLKSAQTTSQVFTTEAGSWACEAASGEGKVKAGAQQSLTEKVQYSKCLLFGNIVTLSEAEYEYLANGTVTLKNTLTAQVKYFNCHITIEPAKEVEKTTYTNLAGGKLGLFEGVSRRFVSRGSGGSSGFCGANREFDSSFEGSMDAELPGSTITWK